MVRKLLPRIDKEDRHTKAARFQPPDQIVFLQPVGLPAQALDAVAIHRLFKMPAAGAKAHLQRANRRGRGRLLRGRRLEQPPNFKRKERQTLSFLKNLFDPLPALEFFPFIQ